MSSIYIEIMVHGERLSQTKFKLKALEVPITPKLYLDPLFYESESWVLSKLMDMKYWPGPEIKTGGNTKWKQFQTLLMKMGQTVWKKRCENNET